MWLGFGKQDFKFHKKITVSVKVTYTRLQISQRNLGLGSGLDLGIQDFKFYKKIGLVLGLRLGLSIQDFKFKEI